MTSVEVPLGAKVQVTAGIGFVRWTGSNPKFSAGKWVGVELIDGGGKNDGAVQGERYFTCAPGHGVFVRPSQVKVLEAPKSRPPSARPPATPTQSRSAAGSASTTRAGSPLKPVAQPQAGPSTPPRKVSSTSQTSPTPSTVRKASTASSARPPSTVFKRPPSVAEAPSTVRRVSSPVKGIVEDAKESRTVVSPVPTSRATSPTPSVTGAPPMRSISGALSNASVPHQTSAVAGPSRSPSPDKEHVAVFAQKRELEELRIKVRLLETHKTQDQARIRELEGMMGEADALRAARVKLQAKFQELQSSLVAAQRSSRDLTSENAQLESRAAEAVDQLEMAALDREVAEEKAEAAEAEVARLQEKLEELELEVAVLKEENAEYERPVSGVEDGRASLAYLQLEKHNERLKEALLKLRDVSSEAERDHKAKIAELEKELTSQEELLRQVELAEAKYNNAEAQVEDLKMQLDDALGAEDMLEQLTERNLQMSERMEEMRITIEDLEALKELNDELEETHVEAEKQLNEEIQSLNNLLRDERQRGGDLDGLVLDMEGTITQFRDLVGSLQVEIDELRAHQATQETETASNSKEAQALMNLNLKLQSTAVKQQSKTIDLELKKLEAAQLAEHLRIVQAYLPDSYQETEASSTAALLLFERLSAKVDIAISTVSSAHGLPASLHSASSEALVGICELRGKLRHFSMLNKRFAGIMQRTDADTWVALGKVLEELAGVENRVDSWIAGLRSDEFHESDCARELSSLIAQFDHLSATMFNMPGLDAAEQQLGLAYSIDYDLDNFAAAVGFARQAVMGLAQDEDIEVDVGDSFLDDGVFEPVQRILDQVRLVKGPSAKLVAETADLLAHGAALLPDLSVALVDLAQAVSNAVDLAVQLAQRIGAHASSLHASKEPLRLVDIERFLSDLVADAAVPSDLPPWEQIGMFIARVGNDLSSTLPKIKTAAKSGQIVTLDVTPPWLTRVAAIKDAASFNADTERKVVKLSEEVKDMLREIKLRDQSLQEAGVKVETLERRLEATRKQADLILELENDVAKAKKQEKVYEDAIEQLQTEQDALEAENARLRKNQPQDGRQANASTAAGTEHVFLGGGSGGTLEVSQLAEQVENLRSAVRFLRNENALLKSRTMYKDLGFLPGLYSTPVKGTRRVPPEAESPVPELDSPGSPSSTDSDLPITPTSRTPPTKLALETETKLLYREIAKFHSAPKIVDISNLGAQGWKSRKQSPEWQLAEWRRTESKLERRLEDLTDQARRLERRR